MYIAIHHVLQRLGLEIANFLFFTISSCLSFRMRYYTIDSAEKGLFHEIWCDGLPCGREIRRRRPAPGRPRPGRWAGGRIRPLPGTARPRTCANQSIRPTANQTTMKRQK